MKWEYKTILVPAMDDWLQHEIELFSTAGGVGVSRDPTAKEKACDEIISKHAAFLDKTLGDLGREGWELVSMWESQPARLFKFSARWMTFKRSV